MESIVKKRITINHPIISIVSKILSNNKIFKFEQIYGKSLCKCKHYILQRIGVYCSTLYIYLHRAEKKISGYIYYQLSVHT